MNIQEQILDMDKYLIDKEYVEGDYIENIEELLLTIETKTLTYDMCCYMYEDDDWATFLVFLGNISQCMTVKKTEIISIGIYNGTDSIEAQKPQEGNNNIYQ